MKKYLIFFSVFSLISLMFAADFEETKHLDEKKPGDLVSATVNPPGTVLTGKVTDAGGWPWMGGPKTFRATVPPGHAGKHMSSFDGTWTKGGSGPGEPLTRTMDVISEATDLKIEIIPKDNFQGRSLTNLGLLEDGKVKVSPKNEGDDIFPLKEFKISSGEEFLSLIQSNLNNGTADFIAAKSSGRATILATSKDGKSLTYEVIVIKPSGGYMKRVPGTSLFHIQNQVSVGFLANIFLLPKVVSFRNLKFREGDGIGKATGYFKHMGYDGQVHPPTPRAINILGGNIDTGCMVEFPDYPRFSDDPVPPLKGTFIWPIKWQYKAEGDDWVTFTTANHNEISDEFGTISMK